MPARISMTAVWTEKMLGFICRLMARELHFFFEFSENIKQIYASYLEIYVTQTAEPFLAPFP